MRKLKVPSQYNEEKEEDSLMRLIALAVEGHWSKKSKVDEELTVTTGCNLRQEDYRLSLNHHLRHHHQHDGKGKPRGAPASISRFMEGASLLGVRKTTTTRSVIKVVKEEIMKDQAFVAYHGTSSEAIKRICRDGWNPQMRQSNPPDRDWYGMDPRESMYYSRRAKSDEMLVVIILKGPHVDACSFSGTYSVAQGSGPVYCLPAAVLFFSDQPINQESRGKRWLALLLAKIRALGRPQ